jgi:hypothetical protein
MNVDDGAPRHTGTGRLSRHVAGYFQTLSSATRWLLALWLLFALLVALGVHGSSINVSAACWRLENPYSPYKDYFLEPLVDGLKRVSGGKTGELPRLLGSEARSIRSDEWIGGTPWALAQCTHSPAFPVVNTNIGLGENMLLVYCTPVWHIAALARPGTWGYLLFGAARGLAWQWWFPAFACFTALYLVLEIVCKKKRGLAAFGAFWYCASGFVVCWSLVPAYVTFFPALGCAAAYCLLKSERPRVQVFCGALVGWSVAGLALCLYPPWQVATGYIFLFVFVALLIRDRLYRFRPSRSRLMAFGLALLIPTILVGAFVWSCRPAIALMANTVYPGQRLSTGGGYDIVSLFRGFYGIVTAYRTPSCFANSSEASSFFLFFPAVFAAALLSHRFRQRLGAIGWALILFMVGILYFMFVGVPESVARITWLRHCPTYRLDIALGLSSILLCTYVLSMQQDAMAASRRLWDRLVPWLGGGALLLLLLVHALVLMKLSQLEVDTHMILLPVLLGGYLGYCMLAGKSEIFCSVLLICLVATSWLYNPLSRGVDVIYGSEMAREILKVDRESGDRPLWLCYGDCGELVYALGCRTLSGIHLHPQPDLWKQLDPENKAAGHHNRYAHVFFHWHDRADPRGVEFGSTTDCLFVTVSPQHPALKRLGARYVLALREYQEPLRKLGLQVKASSPTAQFTIFDLDAPAERE